MHNTDQKLGIGLQNSVLQKLKFMFPQKFNFIKVTFSDIT